MKKRIFPLFVLLLGMMATTALAAGIPGQQRINSVSDGTGYVTTLTDDDASTAWTQSAQSGATLTLDLSGVTVGEVWIRNGYAYTQNWYNHYDRPATVKVTVYYRANQYTTSYDFYRYTLSDVYQPNAYTADAIGGYQRLLLPKQYTGVTKIELTVESSIRGYGNAGVAIADVAVSTGSHVSATPKTYATATPKPYIVYVTPTPGAQGGNATKAPDRETAEPIVPSVTPTPTPLVELITPKPTQAPTPTPTREPVEYPSEVGVIAMLSQRAATRSGPSTGYDEPGTFGSAGDEVKVISKLWDSNNHLWWFQIEFPYRGEWMRAYTTESRVDVDPAIVADEPGEPIETVKCATKCNVYFGPGKEYRRYTVSVIHPGTGCKVYAIENGWVQIEYTDYGLDNMPVRRGWVQKSDLYGE